MKIYQDKTKKKNGTKSWIAADGQSRKLFNTKSEALDYERDVLVQQTNGVFVKVGDRTTVANAVQAYVTYLERRYEAGTIKSKEYKGALNKITLMANMVDFQLLKEVAGKTVNEIDVLDLEKLVERLAEGRSYKTVKNYLITLSNFFRFSMKMRWAASNPVREIVLEDLVKREISYKDNLAKKISDNNINAVLDAAEDEVSKLAILLSTSTGLRAGEQRALTWGDIDFEKNKLSVNKSADENNQIKGPKTKAGVRDIPLRLELKEALQVWKMKSHFSTDNDLVFSTAQGTVLGPNYFMRQVLIPAQKASGIDSFRWHDLRHYFASKLLQNFQDEVWTVTTIMGHADINTTHKIYSHWLEDAARDEKIQNKFNNAWS